VSLTVSYGGQGLMVNGACMLVSSSILEIMLKPNACLPTRRDATRLNSSTRQICARRLLSSRDPA